MVAMNRVRVTWQGLTGLPGVSTFYFDPGFPNAIADIKTFFTAIGGLFQNSLSWTVPGSGDTLDDSTGTLTGGWTASGAGTVVATGGVSSSYAAGVGVRVRWGTSSIVHGRRLQGTTFLTSMVTTSYDSNGSLQGSALTTIGNAATALAGSAGLLVWHRPHPVGVPGLSSLVTSASVPDVVTSLRSRRI